MEGYSVSSLLPGWIDNFDTGSNLFKWYKFLSEIKYTKRDFRNGNLENRFIDDNYIKLYKRYFDIDIEKIIQKRWKKDPNEAKLMTKIYKCLINSILDVHMFLNNTLCMDSDSLKKLLSYDISMLRRLCNIYQLSLYDLFKHVIYDNKLITKELMYEVMPLDKKMKITSINSSITNYIPENITHISFTTVYERDMIVYPRTLKVLIVNNMDYNAYIPNSIEYLNINNVLGRQPLKISSQLKALLVYNGKVDITTLPPSLEYLNIKNIDKDIEHLTKLRILITNKLVVKPPANIEYLSANQVKTDLLHLGSLIAIDTHALDFDIPKSVRHIVAFQINQKLPTTIIYVKYQSMKIEFLPDDIEYIEHIMVFDKEPLTIPENINPRVLIEHDTKRSIYTINPNAKEKEDKCIVM